jgi:ketosteroid isomerase-like protein
MFFQRSLNLMNNHIDTVRSPVDLLSSLVDALKTDDEAAVRALISPDFVYNLDEGMPYGGVFHGPDEFLRVVGEVWKYWGGADFEPQYQIADPDSSKVCTVVLLRGAPGNSTETVETLVNEIWDFRDGQAVEVRIWYSGTNRLSQAVSGSQ